MTEPLERIESALFAIPSEDRQTWLKMGMALHSELGDSGFDIFDRWSQQADSYRSVDTKTVWRSFKAGRVTIRTLFKQALDNGWSGSRERHLLTAIELAEGLHASAERAARAEAEQRQRQQMAAERANRLWHGATAANLLHPYLTAKGIKPHTLRQSGGVLLVPLYHSGELMNLQCIGADGGKRFLSGGRVKGCYSLVGIMTAGKPLYLCEGLATGATIHEETGLPVVCAMNCGNLLEVGRHLQRRHPEAVLIVAGDDDRQTEGNPGKAAAIATASALGCGLILPPWSGSEPPTLTDFNDLRQWQEAHA